MSDHNRTLQPMRELVTECFLVLKSTPAATHIKCFQYVLSCVLMDVHVFHLCPCAGRRENAALLPPPWITLLVTAMCQRHVAHPGRHEWNVDVQPSRMFPWMFLWDGGEEVQRWVTELNILLPSAAHGSYITTCRGDSSDQLFVDSSAGTKTFHRLLRPSHEVCGELHNLDHDHLTTKHSDTPRPVFSPRVMYCNWHLKIWKFSALLWQQTWTHVVVFETHLPTSAFH